MMTLPEALKACYQGRPYEGRTLRQVDIAEECTRRGFPLQQTTVSDYVTGKSEAPRQFIRLLEDISGRHRGYVYVLTGDVEMPDSLEDRVLMESRLSDEAKDLVLGVIEGLVSGRQKDGRAGTRARGRR